MITGFLHVISTQQIIWIPDSNVRFILCPKSCPSIEDVVLHKVVIWGSFVLNTVRVSKPPPNVGHVPPYTYQQHLTTHLIKQISGISPYPSHQLWNTSRVIL